MEPRFRDRFDNIEQHRQKLLERLHLTGVRGESHPAFKRARTLLNQTFRRASLAQRVAVLQAASWVIDLIERSIGLL